MDRINRKVIAACKKGVPIIVTWEDAVDDSCKEVKDFKITYTEVRWHTIGYYLGILNDTLFLGYNQEENDCNYTGVGQIPCSLIKDIRRLSNV